MLVGFEPGVSALRVGGSGKHRPILPTRPGPTWKTRADARHLLAGVDFRIPRRHLAAPMELILACACDDARVRPDGKLDVTGIFNELSAPGFPAMQDRMTVVFVVEWGPGETGRIPLRADLVDEAERAVLTIQGHTDVEPRGEGRARPQTRLIMPLEEVVFPSAGRYHLDLKAGNEVRRAFSLFVGEHEEG